MFKIYTMNQVILPLDLEKKSLLKLKQRTARRTRTKKST